MNKDAILATVIGLLLGLTIAGTFMFGPRLIKALPKLKVAPKVTPTPTSVPKEFSVTITAPLPDAVEPKADVVVSGTTAPGAIVVIEGTTDEDVVVAGEGGAYAGKVTAGEGKNEITVTAYGNGKQAQNTITVFFTEESL